MRLYVCYMSTFGSFPGLRPITAGKGLVSATHEVPNPSRFKYVQVRTHGFRRGAKVLLFFAGRACPPWRGLGDHNRMVTLCGQDRDSASQMSASVLPRSMGEAPLVRLRIWGSTASPCTSWVGCEVVHTSQESHWADPHIICGAFAAAFVYAGARLCMASWDVNPGQSQD